MQPQVPRPASQHRSCARSGDRDGSWGASQAVRHETVVAAAIGGGHGPQQYERHCLDGQARQQNGCAACAEAAACIGVRTRHGRGATVRRGQVNVAIDKLMAGRVSGSVTMYVRVRVIVPAAARGRQVMIGAERAIRHERKRRHDRQTGRKALGLQTEVTNHTSTDSRYVSKILVADIITVQSGQSHKSTPTARIWWHSVNDRWRKSGTNAPPRN